MPAVSFSPVGNMYQAFSSAGLPLSLGTIDTYISGTSTQLATYTTAAGNIANSNPITLLSDGRPPQEIWLIQGSAYRFVLKDALGNQIGTYDDIRGIDATLRADLAAPGGAGLIGTADAGGYFNTSTVEGELQELGNPDGQFQLDGVNVLRYIPTAEWAAIFAYTSTTDLYTYLQAALTAEPNLIFPNGRFNTGTKLIPRTDAKIRGINRRGTQLRGIGAITTIEFPMLTVDPVVERIYFTGSVAGGTGITVANTGGAFHDYLIRPEIRQCDFAWELAYGINADLIYADIHHNTFGYYGTVGAQPAPGASTMVGIRAYVVTGNPPNHNHIHHNIFACGSLTQAALDISGPVSFEIGPKNDFSFGGMAINVASAALIDIHGNWFEGNVATNHIISLSGITSQAQITTNNLVSNTADRHITYSSTEPGASIVRNVFGLPVGAGYPIYDNATTSRLLPGTGVLEWYGNIVSGGNAANRVVTGTEFQGGRTSPRVTFSVDTTPAGGSILYCSDPNATIGKTGTGDVTLTVSQPLGTAANNIAVVATPRTGSEIRAVGVTTTTIRIQVFDSTSVAVNSIVGGVAYGA